MGKIVEELLEMGLGNIIEYSIEEQLKNDEIYIQNKKELAEQEKQLEALNLDQYQQKIVEDYTVSIWTANARVCDIAYLVGVRNTLLMLKEIEVF
ncbi:MAG: hypothetical protein IKJ01_02915 [Lachnospiraceae bacterium]|nr:hypothetical protein [Lachnospiraceae bacterium]